MTRYEMRIAGFGGQGIITLSKMIITASSLYENLAATQIEAYGSSARGGRCWAEVVVDLDKNIKIIDYPKALSPYDFLIILSEESASRVNPDNIKKDENTLKTNVQSKRSCLYSIDEITIDLFCGSFYIV